MSLLKNKFYIFLYAFLFVACSQNSKKEDGAHLPKKTAVSEVIAEDEQVQVETLTIEGLQKAESKEEGTNPDLGVKVSPFGEIPDVDNAQVQKWMNYFQGRGRKHMNVYLKRSSRYLGLMKKILIDKGLPPDLVYISLIESGFRATAHSHASAVGYWQFIRGTGKRYGLRSTLYKDDRRDPFMATEAAAAYFTDLYNLFGDWFLAMASYNAGERRVQRAVKRARDKDFWVLAQRRLLPRETRNYVPKYLAARKIAKNPELYGFFDIDYQPPLVFETVQVNKSVSLALLAKKIGHTYKELFALNPKFRSDWVPVRDKPVEIRVPFGKRQVAMASIEGSYSNKPLQAFSTHFWYRIRRGDNLSRLARRFGTSVRKLRTMNGLSRRSLLRIGKKLRIPRRGGGSYHVAKKRRKAPAHKAGAQYHRVRRGENLSVIARRYGLSILQLKRLNRLGRRSLIRVGQKLKVRVSSVDSSSGSRRLNRSNQFHRVRRGDNLTNIASRYGLSLNELRKLNGLGRRSLIRSGQRLRVQEGVKKRSKRKKVHVVKRGESLIKIARYYQKSVALIAKANAIRNYSKIKAGDKIIIPK